MECATTQARRVNDLREVMLYPKSLYFVSLHKLGAVGDQSNGAAIGCNCQCLVGVLVQAQGRQVRPVCIDKFAQLGVAVLRDMFGQCEPKQITEVPRVQQRGHFVRKIWRAERVSGPGGRGLKPDTAKSRSA